MTLPSPTYAITATLVLAALAFSLACLKMPAGEIMMILTPVSAPSAVVAARIQQRPQPNDEQNDSENQ